MKKTINVVKDLIRYFDAVVIGSQLFVDKGLLSEEDINDIDIAATGDEKGMFKYLSDLGFTKTDLTTGAPYNKAIARTKWTHTDYDKVIDVNYFNHKPSVFKIPELVKAKFESGRVDDLKQLSMVMFNAGGNSLMSYRDLQDFYLNNMPNDDDTTA